MAASVYNITVVGETILKEDYSPNQHRNPYWTNDDRIKQYHNKIMRSFPKTLIRSFQTVHFYYIYKPKPLAQA